jgi:hypothetical protein
MMNIVNLSACLPSRLIDSRLVKGHDYTNLRVFANVWRHRSGICVEEFRSLTSCAAVESFSKISSMGQKVLGRGLGNRCGPSKVNAPESAAVLRSLLAAGVVHENAAHGLGGGGEESAGKHKTAGATQPLAPLRIAKAEDIR